MFTLDSNTTLIRQGYASATPSSSLVLLLLH